MSVILVVAFSSRAELCHNSAWTGVALPNPIRLQKATKVAAKANPAIEFAICP